MSMTFGLTRPRRTTLDQLVLASHLLGANRAVSNFGGGNTSAKGIDDRPRRP